MNNRFSVMKRIAILCISFFISCCVNTLGLSEEMYAENNDYEYSSRRKCPSYEINKIMDGAFQTKAAIALRSWFISEYAFQNDWYDDLYSNNSVILLEPYIIKCENKGDEFIIYCSSDISSYALFESEDGKLYLSQGLNKTGLFRIYFEIYSQCDWRVISVQLLEGNDEELYPGVGIGTDGFPGLSDQLEKEIPEWGLDTYHIAQKYLDLNELDADVIMW